MYKLLKDSLKIRRYLLVTILVIQFISVILSTLLPYMNGMFVDMLIDIKNVEEVIKYAITIAGVGIISLFLSYIYNLKIMKVKNNISFEINSRGILHLQKIPLEIEYEPTYMTQRLNSDSRIVVDFFFDKIITATINLFVMFFLISLLFYLSKPIFGVTILDMRDYNTPEELYNAISIRAKVFMYVEDYYLLRKEDEIYGVISIVNGKVYINQTSFIGKIVLTKSFNQQVLKDFIGSVLINYKNEVKKDSKKIRISFENKDTEIYKELIQSLIELSFIKVAELKDELTIGQDVLIYDYFY